MSFIDFIRYEIDIFIERSRVGFYLMETGVGSLEFGYGLGSYRVKSGSFILNGIGSHLFVGR